jgi:hypothetical protein
MAAAEGEKRKKWFKPGNPNASADGGCWLQPRETAVACGNSILQREWE